MSNHSPLSLRLTLALGASLFGCAVSSCAAPAVTSSDSPTPAAPAASATASSTTATSGMPTPTPPTLGPEADFETLDLSTFTNPTAITNPWFPLTPGTRLIYEGTTVDGKEELAHRIDFMVTDLVKEVAGVQTVVAYVVDYEDDELVEKELAFYAQADDGTVWYMGEHPEEFDDGEFDKAPTWFHNVGDGKAGIAMPGNPQVSERSFSEGWAPSVDFSDRGRVVAVDERICIELKCYEPVVVIDEFAEAEPNATQIKYYAQGVGNVKVGWRGDDTQREELELVKVSTLKADALARVRTLALALEGHAYTISKEVYGTTKPMA